MNPSLIQNNIFPRTCYLEDCTVLQTVCCFAISCDLVPSANLGLAALSLALSCLLIQHSSLIGMRGTEGHLCITTPQLGWSYLQTWDCPLNFNFEVRFPTYLHRHWCPEFPWTPKRGREVEVLVCINLSLGLMAEGQWGTPKLESKAKEKQELEGQPASVSAHCAPNAG